MSNESWLQCLVGPLGEPTLRKTDKGLESERQSYPLIGGVPWLYRDPRAQLRQWKKKLRDVVEYGHQQIEAAERSLAHAVTPSGRKRLELLIEGHEENLRCLEPLVKDLLLAEEVESILSLEKIPRQQSAMAYQATIFRDWAWGKNEIQRFADRLENHLKGKRRILSPGAGACGLPLEIHLRVKPEISLAVDINPLLLLPVAQLLSGKPVSLIEFPRLAVAESAIFKRHTITAAEQIANFHLLFADAQTLPLKAGFFDGLLTSWFIDIVPRPFSELAREMNHSLSMGGVWANIGTLGFEKNDLALVHGPAEIREILEESGFKVTHFETLKTAYLESPFDAVGRLDTVWTFAAEKVKNVARPAQFEYLPKWLLDIKTPIPRNEAIEGLSVKSTIYGFVLELVDGQRGLKDIAQLVAQEFNLNPQEAEQSVHQFFTNVYEGVIYREF